MLRRPTGATLTDTRYPYPTLFRVPCPIPGRGSRHVDTPRAEARDAVAAGADRFDDEFSLHDHYPASRAAAIRNSMLPSGPVIGLSITPRTVHPGSEPNQEIGRASCRERVCQYV